MRVAYLSTDPGIAYGGVKGAAIHVEQLVRALAAEVDEVLLVVASHVGDHVAPPNVTVEVLPASETPAAWVQERMAEFGADLLYERLALHSNAGTSAAHELGLTHVVELNARLPEEAARYRGLELDDETDRLEREVLEHADLVLAVSRPLADYARGRGARRVSVLPNAVAPELFEQVSRQEDVPAVAVFAGSLRPWHGVEVVAEAWRLLGAEAPELLVVGDGPGRSLLENAGARVTGHVRHAAVPALLAGAHIGLAPYASGAPDYFSPLKLFEYLAAGLATVAADLPGVREVVGPETAVLVPRGDAAALAEAVAGLAADPVRRERLGRAGRALVVERHTWAHRARAILELAEALTPTGSHA